MTDPDFDVEPADRSLIPLDAEMAALHVAFWTPIAATAAKITGGQFYDPRRGALWDALLELQAHDIKPDVTTIANQMGVKGEKLADLGRLLMDVTDSSHPAHAGNIAEYAAAITDRAERRRLLENVLPGARQRLLDTTQPLDEGVAYLERGLTGTGAMDREADRLFTFDEFVGQDLPPMEWVIPNLIARDERMVLTGREGSGKTQWLRQIAACAAAGVNPITLHAMTPRNVLLIDCENPNRIMVNKFTDIGQALAKMHRKPQNLSIRRFPEGMDLGTVEDRMRLRRLCQITQPDLVIAGPVYKMYVGGSNQREEDLAAVVTRALDSLREEFKFALILEHHMPKSSGGSIDGAPIGSSLWMRWPEFGLSLKLTEESTFNNRQAEVLHWRGDREERDWPPYLTSGGVGNLPWIDTVATGRP